MIERAIAVALAGPWLASAAGWAYLVAAHEVVSTGVDWLHAGRAAGRRAVRPLPLVAHLVEDPVSPFTRWLCRACKEVFTTEEAMVEHISTTGHTDVSLQRSRSLSG